MKKDEFISIGYSDLEYRLKFFENALLTERHFQTRKGLLKRHARCMAEIQKRDLISKGKWKKSGER